MAGKWVGWILGDWGGSAALGGGSAGILYDAVELVVLI